MVVWFLGVLAVLVAAGTAFGIFLGLLQNFHPAFDSFSHFRLHLILVFILCCAVLFLVPVKKTRIVALLLIACGAGWLAFEYSKGPAENGARGDIRLVQFNLKYRNRIIDQVGQQLVAYDADVVLLQEVTRAHEAALRGLSHYPHQQHCFFPEYVGGVSILSKHPLSSVDCAKGQGMATAQVDFPSGAVTVSSIHALWPWPYNQHGQINRWRQRLQATTGPTIIAGDFNAAPWSHAVSKVEKASNTKVVPGIRMTIGVKLYSFLPAVPIPIDHTLLSNEFCAISARVGDPLGSDHYPVIFDIVRVGSVTNQGC